jgi:hypothetical protein
MDIQLLGSTLDGFRHATRRMAPMGAVVALVLLVWGFAPFEPDATASPPAAAVTQVAQSAPAAEPEARTFGFPTPVRTRVRSHVTHLVYVCSVPEQA